MRLGSNLTESSQETAPLQENKLLQSIKYKSY
jgi:hypothetical protein